MNKLYTALIIDDEAPARQGLQHLLNEFYKLGHALQFGVYVDFFDYVKTPIEICITPWNGKFYFMVDDSSEEVEMFEDRNTTRVLSIEKANELFNAQE